MHATIYSQIAAIAAPIVTAYHDDIRRHDLATLRRFDIGDSALWACYDCGSHMVRLSFSEHMTIADRLESTRRGLDFFNAACSVFGDRLHWHLLESTGGVRGTVRPISPERARSLFVDKIRDLENGVSLAARLAHARRTVGGLSAIELRNLVARYSGLGDRFTGEERAKREAARFLLAHGAELAA